MGADSAAIVNVLKVRMEGEKCRSKEKGGGMEGSEDRAVNFIAAVRFWWGGTSAQIAANFELARF